MLLLLCTARHVNKQLFAKKFAVSVEMLCSAALKKPNKSVSVISNQYYSAFISSSFPCFIF